MINKILRWLFFLFIVLLPSQLGKHWWPEWSLVDGVRVDYLAPTIYLTDILVLLIALCILFQKTQKTLMTGYPQKFRKPENQKFRLSDLLSFRFSGFPSIPSVLIIFFLSVGCWIYIADRRWLAAYWLARYLEIPLAAFLIIKMRMIRGERRIRREIIIALAMAVLFSVGLGAAQMILGKTTGWFWRLGERNFNLATPGVATMTVLGREILRPYATFGHPNALGGFLAAVIIFLKVQPWRPPAGEAGTPRLDLLSTIGVIGVILTGSRGAIAALAIAALLQYQKSKIKNQKLLMLILIFGGLGVLGLWARLGESGISGISGKSEISERLVLTEAAMKMWRENWLAGVGPGQFLVELPEYLPAGFYKIQPVHNVFLLWLAEFGILGMSIIVIIIIKIIKSAVGAKSADLKWPAVLAVILVTGMVDHYWLTAQQNRLLLGVILGLVLAPLLISDCGLRLRSKK